MELKTLIFIITIVITTPLPSLSSQTPSNKTPTLTSSQYKSLTRNTIQQQFLRPHNALRAKLHLPPLKWSNSLARYAIDKKTGRLTPLGQTATEKTPREFAIDPSGRFLYAAGQDSGKLAAYRIDLATGELTAIEKYEVGKGPAWVLVVRVND